jgi:hypothetical protein
LNARERGAPRGCSACARSSDVRLGGRIHDRDRPPSLDHPPTLLEGQPRRHPDRQGVVPVPPIHRAQPHRHPPRRRPRGEGPDDEGPSPSGRAYARAPPPHCVPRGAQLRRARVAGAHSYLLVLRGKGHRTFDACQKFCANFMARRARSGEKRSGESGKLHHLGEKWGCRAGLRHGTYVALVLHHEEPEPCETYRRL